MIKICLSGARGKMGLMLYRLIGEAEDLTLVSALERHDHPEMGCSLGDGIVLTDDAEAAIAKADVLLDFSLPEAVTEHVSFAANSGVSVVTGTTGLDEEQMSTLNRAASYVAVVYGSNMSRGVHVLGELVKKAASLLGPEFDVEIVEAHHNVKKDSPSGTALQLGRSIQNIRGGRLVYARQAKRESGEIGICSVRGGDIVGEHEVMFLGPGERLSVTHLASTREHFCRGALEAVRFVHDSTPGFYSMKQVFKRVV